MSNDSLSLCCGAATISIGFSSLPFLSFLDRLPPVAQRGVHISPAVFGRRRSRASWVMRGWLWGMNKQSISHAQARSCAPIPANMAL
jgi:hypothetical protein